MIIESFRIRALIIVTVLVFGTLYLLPNFVELPKGWWFHQQPINYGLDIKGGAHLVYGVDVKSVIEEKINRTSRSLASEFKERQIPVNSVKTSDDQKNIILDFPASSKDAVTSYLDDFHGTSLQVVEETGTSMTLHFLDTYLEHLKGQIIQQAIEVIRNRVDEFGVSEPVIAAQGESRVLVQLPGVDDPQQAKALINKTARLEFRMVSTAMPGDQVQKLIADAEKNGNYKLGGPSEDGAPMSYSAYIKRLNEDLKGKIPEGTEVAFEKAPSAVTLEAGKIPYLLNKDSDLTGDQLEDAYVSYSQDNGKPLVIFAFDPDGRRRFSEITGENVGKLMAIVLDDVVQSAPQIQGKIDSRTAQITLGSGRRNDDLMKEAQFIATTLRAGALPAALEQMEERTVGPTLGADSIQKGKVAGLVGLVIVALFMVVWYKVSGLIATIALTANVFCLLAILSALGATLTLPGIAGIVLTLGMAVDANVIIFERIKEEMAKGSSWSGAMKDGYRHAFSAIMDSNVTTAMAGVILFYFGSGPIRGFGVTLIAGIVTSLFTAIFVTRFIFDFMVLKLKTKSVSI
ncbi:MAG: protein translocase subunit SecD [Bdellovibrionaceae bacterium]|nr:protein translocase subunit SecD [Pseudobdellovibrionaceae bacterium]|tara:strand:+ start:1154 stop:2869 length:1716 start_codon:yes stop_codon:yes gene_type:complete